MSETVVECPVCRVRMEDGRVIDASNKTSMFKMIWVEGEPERSVFGVYKLRGKRRFTAVAYRCPHCGWLIWFAPDPHD